MRPRNIKQLVFDMIRESGGRVDCATVTSEVLRHFPESRWNPTHWNYYRSGICSPNGRYYGEFDEVVRRNLSKRIAAKSGQAAAPTAPVLSETRSSGTRGPGARDPQVKQVGDKLLKYIRYRLDQECEDEDRRFAVNRWIFARLLQDEIRLKRPIKQALWKSGMTTCRDCGKDFRGLKGLELHRVDPARRYSLENCVLLCRPCHEIADLEAGR